METLARLLAFSIGLAMLASWGQERPFQPLLAVSELNALSLPQADLRVPVRVRGVLTLYTPQYYLAFLQQDRHGVYVAVRPNHPWKVQAGDEVEITGTSAMGGYAPIIDPTDIRKVGHLGLPEPIRITIADALADRYPNSLVELDGVQVVAPRTMSEVPGFDWAGIVLLDMGGSPGMLSGAEFRPGQFEDLRNTMVRLRAILGSEYNMARQRIEPHFHAVDDRPLQKLSQRSIDWSAAPLIDLKTLLRHQGAQPDEGELVRLQGVVNYVDLGTLYLSNGTALCVDPFIAEGVKVGDTLEVIGRIEYRRRPVPFLRSARARRIPLKLPLPEPVVASEIDLANPIHAGTLITMTGIVTAQVSSVGFESIDLQTPEKQEPFTAELYREVDATKLPHFNPGDRISVTGVLHPSSRNWLLRTVKHRLLLRNSKGVELIARPSFWRTLPWGKITIASGGTAIAMLGWVWLLRRQVRAQTEILNLKSAALEEAAGFAQQANQAKSDFLANMSHEIRTPLNGVLGMISLAQQQPLSPQQREDLQWAQRSAEGLLAILNDTLDLSKIEKGKLVLQVEAFHLTAMFEEVVRLFSPAAGQKELELRWEWTGEPDEWVLGDPVRIRQVFLNLVGNALKFTAEGGVTLRAARSGSRVSFEVADTGIGIPQDKLDVIFGAFEQADQSVTREYGGTGLGLTIAQRLVELMGGDLQVTSMVGQGTQFCFNLPLPATTAPELAANSMTVSRANLRLLVAEDNQVNQRLALRILGQLGHTCVLARDGREAVNLFFAEGPFDAVLMDIRMPEMGGIEATACIRAGESGAATPIVALTAHAMEGDRSRFVEAGMNDYLAKPVRQSDIAQCLGRVCPAPAPLPGLSPVPVQSPAP